MSYPGAAMLAMLCFIVGVRFGLWTIDHASPKGIEKQLNRWKKRTDDLSAQGAIKAEMARQIWAVVDRHSPEKPQP